MNNVKTKYTIWMSNKQPQSTIKSLVSVINHEAVRLGKYSCQVEMVSLTDNAIDADDENQHMWMLIGSKEAGDFFKEFQERLGKEIK